MMLQLETRAGWTMRRLAASDPHLFSHPVTAFQWEMHPLNTDKVDWEDRSTHKILTCVNHPKSRWSTKNPFDRSIFLMKGVSGGEPLFDTGCNCSFKELRVLIYE